MWFKNIQIYALAEPFTLTAEALHDALSQDKTRECGKLEKQTLGWVAPLGQEHENLVHALNGCIMICMRKQQRLLPSTVVKQIAADKIAEIELSEQRNVSAKERRNIIDELSVTLLPQAFTTYSDLYAYIDTKNQWLIIDSASATKAEELTVLLRQSLGSLKVASLSVNSDCHQLMTGWVREGIIDTGWYIEDTCELVDPRAQTTQIKCVNQDLAATEVQGHLQSGKIVTKLAVTWQDRVSFMLDKTLCLKRVKLLDLVQEQLNDMEIQNKVQQFEVDFAIMSAEFQAFLPDLIKLLGGLQTTAASAAKMVV